MLREGTEEVEDGREAVIEGEREGEREGGVKIGRKEETAEVGGREGRDEVGVSEERGEEEVTLRSDGNETVLRLTLSAFSLTFLFFERWMLKGGGGNERRSPSPPFPFLFFERVRERGGGERGPSFLSQLSLTFPSFSSLLLSSIVCVSCICVVVDDEGVCAADWCEGAGACVRVSDICVGVIDDGVSVACVCMCVED